MNERARIADFWDNVLDLWIRGEDVMSLDPLARWAGAYAGSGDGAVDLRHYPDPYVGDLRGETHSARLVLLGLNPGIGFDELQARDGIWAKRVTETGLSRCFARSPAADPETWLKYRGKPSRYWENAIRFGRRWLEDDRVGVHDILNLELYPWHSNRMTAAMRVPSDIVAKYVFAPIAETDVPTVFAFGVAWFEVASSLGLHLLASPTSVELGMPPSDRSNWRVGVFQLSKRQRLLVSSQSGYSGPPGANRIIALRSILARL